MTGPEPGSGRKQGFGGAVATLLGAAAIVGGHLRWPQDQAGRLYPGAMPDAGAANDEGRGAGPAVSPCAFLALRCLAVPDLALRRPGGRTPSYSMALTMSSTTFLASPKTIMVLSM